MPTRPSEHEIVGIPSPELSHTLLLSGLSTHNTHSTHSTDSAIVMPNATPRRKMRPPTPSLFHTREFKFYYLVYLTVVPHMMYTMWQSSSPSRPEYKEYSRALSDGWMFGRQVDLSDGQWDTFRERLWIFALAMFAFVALNRVFRRMVDRMGVSSQLRGTLPQLWFVCVFATAFIVVLSGTSIIFIIGLVGMNYVVTKLCAGRKWAPLVIWAYSMAMLFSNERYKGYSFGHIAEPLAWLDEWRGLLHRWDIMFNLTMLRMVSFAMDYHWRVCQDNDAGVQRTDALVDTAQTPRDRVENACFVGNYSFGNYWAYLMYPPLYLTGPIITFNDFVAQMRRPCVATSMRETLVYGLRLVCAGLLMELVLHSVYCVAISKWAHWDTYSVYEISLIGYMRLTFIWLKLLIIWRFARFWAMVDGLETVENMRRCMSNNYSLQQFWRDWHCSYNRWLVRYVYIPLGGRRTSSWNTFIVFTFVALWHDLTLRLLQWAWIIALLFLPEALASWFFNRPKWTNRPYFRFLCSMGGALNIVGMMVANLVGFGDAGVDKMLRMFCSVKGSVFLAVTFVVLNVHLQVMFELREREYRKEYALHEHSVEMTAHVSQSKHTKAAKRA